MTPEGAFKAKLVQELKEMFPGCIILRNDPQQIQGIPDLVILYGDKWAALETKAYTRAAKRPNQPHRVTQMNEMSYAAFVSPENKKEVLDALQCALQPSRKARIPKP